MVENAIELAITQANESGGLEGRLYGAIFCTIDENPAYDSLEFNEAAVASAEFLVHRVGVPAIVGPTTSGSTERVFTEVTRDAEVVVISPSATSPSLSSASRGPTVTVFRSASLLTT